MATGHFHAFEGQCPSTYSNGASADSAAKSMYRSSILNKTKMCRYHLAGQCMNGRACTFAHNEAELRPMPTLYKTRICPDFANTGFCAAGDECKFAHTKSELR
eukprot:CAMPEP_0170308088 /NCGR_PEP_ID=MMETSP0116_2-20130129/54476_1 /TAXON_ID=400756 /ORGANISM="Durinskia baltica, Strain CSIRO CS-38" /LENGTH=102 /DNA_ID=CAMNT_0010560255 /DNA_START=15 /DNA_END=320 /DNA_ORIENTATION=+